MNKRISILFLFMAMVLGLNAQNQEDRKIVKLVTDSGTIRIALYNETPKHRDNFLKLVKEGYYDGILFHRVISNFMIQTGDSATRHAKPGDLLGDTYEPYKIPAEIRFPEIFHKRGVVAAAREGDDVNPQRESSMSQFYIAWGKRFNGNDIADMEERLSRSLGQVFSFPPEVKEAYYKYGGIPHLDGQYTVFGEVIEGMDVVNKIQWAETDGNDRPLIDIHIIKATIERE